MRRKALIRYCKRDTAELYAKLQSAATPEDLVELKEFIPKSNWDRYFSSLVDCNDDYLRTRWNDLYALRCKVAHNAIIAKDDYDRLLELCADLKGKIEQAILKVYELNVSGEERDLIAASAERVTEDLRKYAVEEGDRKASQNIARHQRPLVEYDTLAKIYAVPDIKLFDTSPWQDLLGNIHQQNKRAVEGIFDHLRGVVESSVYFPSLYSPLEKQIPPAKPSMTAIEAAEEKADTGLPDSAAEKIA